MELIKKQTKIDFMGHRRLALGFSLILPLLYDLQPAIGP